MFPRTPGISTTSQRKRVAAALAYGQPGAPDVSALQGLVDANRSQFVPSSSHWATFGRNWTAGAATTSQERPGKTLYVHGAFDLFNPVSCTASDFLVSYASGGGASLQCATVYRGARCAMLLMLHHSGDVHRVILHFLRQYGARRAQGLNSLLACSMTRMWRVRLVTRFCRLFHCKSEHWHCCRTAPWTMCCSGCLWS
eukprot:COSAG02_NODE_26_length_51927_cov_61.213881_38_plen_198_part_00